MFERRDRIHEPLHVVTTIFNPVRYRSRWKLYEDFARMVQRSGAILHTVEVSFGDRDNVLHPYDDGNAIPPEIDGTYTRLQTGHELWLKENAINIGFSRLPFDWKYAAWIDADIAFSRGDWANETLHQLQHHPVIQLWTESADLSPRYEILRRFRSFAWCHKNDEESTVPGGDDYYYGGSSTTKTGFYWHPGFAWAIRRDAFNALGGLIDWAILGSGDFFMANALAGRMLPVSKQLGEAGFRWLESWKERADKNIRQDIGYMDGLILHHWHGAKVNRRYKDRWKILVNANFNAETDLRRDWQGLYQLNPENVKLRDGIREYFRQRNEDSIDLE